MNRRNPRLPQVFVPHLLSGDDLEYGGPEAMADAGAEAILEALDAPGRNREAAFRLLAGDAFLTYACEGAVDEEDPGALLEAILAHLGDRFR